MPMSTQAVEVACAFAWRNYLLLHTGVREDDERRDSLYDYVTSICETRDYDFDVLQVAAIEYLKKLDESHEEWDARLAADDVLAKCLAERRSRNG
jgi:hypothetical protein